AHKMKRKNPLVVPLTGRALAIARAMVAAAGADGRVFPTARARVRDCLVLPQHMGRSGCTVHGFRATFASWAADPTAFAEDVCRAALAHKVKGVWAAYQRGALLEKRRALMTEWDAACAAAPVADLARAA